MKLTIREYRSICFGYYRDHYIIEDDECREIFDTHEEEICKQLYDFLKEVGSTQVMHIHRFFRGLWVMSEHYQFYYRTPEELMEAVSN